MNEREKLNKEDGLNDIYERFLDFEEENNVFSKQVVGIKYWHYLRHQLLNKQIAKNKFGHKQADAKIKENYKLNKILDGLKLLSYSLLKNPFLAKNCDIMVLNHPRRIKSGDYYEDIYTDEIINNLNGLSYVVIEKPYLGKHYRPAVTQNIRYMDLIILTRGFIKCVYNRFNKYSLTEQEVSEIKSIIHKLNRELNISIDAKNYAKQVQDLVLTYKSNYWLFEVLIKRINPKIILEVASSRFEAKLINEIAKKYNIRTIELQHAVIKHHGNYNYKEKVYLPAFPDYFFMFGKYWKNGNRLPLNEENIIITGFPYYEKKKQKYLSRCAGNQKISYILFVSQGPIGDKLSRLASNLNKRLDQKYYKIIYKLHPGEYEKWKYLYPWLVEANIDVIDNNEKDIHYFCSISDYLVGVYSTAIIEGLGYNLKTFIFKVPGYETVIDLCYLGVALLVNNEEEILSNLDMQEKKNEEMENYFWEKDSLYKTTKAIRDILTCLTNSKL